jgi:hypothetical protein
MRLSVSRVSSFNDPFELHFKPGQPLTRSGAKKHLRDRMRRPTFWARAAAHFPNLSHKQLKRTIANFRGRLISGHIDAQDSLVEFHRSNPGKSMDRNVRLMCFTELKHEDPAEIPMWGYYAAKHQGVRIHVRRQFFEQAGFSLAFHIIFAEVGIGLFFLMGSRKGCICGRIVRFISSWPSDGREKVRFLSRSA